MRTVGVRVVIPNPDGLLRVGDYAKATIDVPLAPAGGRPHAIYDPELADKWISPRHPHIVESAAGKCPICGVDLVPASQFGFTATPHGDSETLVVPRDAVLMAGDNSVVYVETEPGRFEIRPVVLGGHSGDNAVVISGLNKGEHVATRGNFLIDSQMQLAGNPSLIDPNKALPSPDSAIPAEVIAVLSHLSVSDRDLAKTQRVCPVSMLALGSMGVPKKVVVDGREVFICCDACRKKLLDDPQGFLSKLAGGRAKAAEGDSPPRREPPSAADADRSPQENEPRGEERRP